MNNSFINFNAHQMSTTKRSLIDFLHKELGKVESYNTVIGSKSKATCVFNTGFVAEVELLDKDEYKIKIRRK